MKRLLRTALLMAGLLWLAPAVRALPLSVDDASPGQAGLVGLPDGAGLAVAVPEPVATPVALRERTAGAASPSAPARGLPALLYVGLLGLVILGTDRRVLAEALLDAGRPDRSEAPPEAAPVESPPSRRRDARHTRLRL